MQTTAADQLEAFGVPWILWNRNRGGDRWLYNISTGKWRRLGCRDRVCRVGSAGTTVYVNGEPVTGSVQGIGARWVLFRVDEPGTCPDDIHQTCGPITYHAFNLKTHKIRHNVTTTSTSVVDLDSPSLVRPLCRPLQVPPQVGAVTLYGTFAVVAEATQTYPQQFLEHCGTQLHMPVGFDGDLYANNHGLIWRILDQHGHWHGQLSGVLLPSLRRFTIAWPRSIQTGEPAYIRIDAYRLYVEDKKNTWWAAPFPPRPTNA